MKLSCRICQLALVLCLVAGSRKLEAQFVSGVVRDARTSAPLASVELLLSHAGDTTRGRTSGDGTFRIRAPGPGIYLLDARRIGYSPVLGRQLRISQDGLSELVVSMYSVAQQLDTVTTSGAATLSKLTPGSEMVRRHLLLGKGLIVSGLAIEKSGMLLSEYLGHLAGVKLSRAPVSTSPTIPARNGFLMMSTKGQPACLYGRINHTSVLQLLVARDQESIDDLLDPREVMAVEIYRTPQEIPIEWRMDMLVE
jgi:hypothetical protein